MSRNLSTQLSNSSQPSTWWRFANSSNVFDCATDVVISRFSFMPDEPSALNSQNFTRPSSSFRNVSTRANGSTAS